MGIMFDPLNNTVILEDGRQVTFEEWARTERVNGSYDFWTAPAAPPQTTEEPKDQTEKDKQREFFFGKPEELYGQAKEWRAEGRCPKCGELGRIHLSTFICSWHGPY